MAVGFWRRCSEVRCLAVGHESRQIDRLGTTQVLKRILQPKLGRVVSKKHLQDVVPVRFEVLAFVDNQAIELW